MKRILILAATFGALLTATVLFGHIAEAQTAPMTEEHIARIRSNCIEAQSTLNQLHSSDALLRVNRGQLYEYISTKLMAPFNSRLALNHLDGGTLVTVAKTYEDQLGTFRINYQQYEEAMSRTLKINCNNQPVAFYDSVGDTRTKRKKVHDSTLLLQKTIQDYKDQFEIFAQKFKEGKA
jgi:hypothetical protein